jgi:hypothetical protein
MYIKMWKKLMIINNEVSVNTKWFFINNKNMDDG